MDWMLNHSGIAAVTENEDNTITIIKASENPSDFQDIVYYAKSNGYTIIYGALEGGVRLGYLRG